MPKKTETVVYDAGLLTDHDIHLFKEGNQFRLYEKLGSHLMTAGELEGTYFAVWAPNAASVSVIGDFNRWNPESHLLNETKGGSGIWEGFVPGVGKGAPYKYHIVAKSTGYTVNKGDPFAFFWEPPPRNASLVWDLIYQWGDAEWMKNQPTKNALDAAVAIYEVHLGSWRRVQEENGRFFTYREMAHPLAEYVKEMGFTHVEFLPIMEHPFYGSWGYQTIGYFAPTSRYGTPQDFMYLVDYLHQQGIGVILDWVPSHFPSDEDGLSNFDGTHLYEYADPSKGFHPEWTSCIFDYGQEKVQAFLISNALFWLDKYHAEGFRVDAVASMLYLDYARKEGEWTPNEYGGRENLEAVCFLCRLNEAVYANYPDTQTVAEESTAWPKVSRPANLGGLGFGLKWNMGWMHDTLDYFSRDSKDPKRHHKQLTFSIWYAFSENFVLPLSHDEVVYGKGSLINKMRGDERQKFDNLRLLFGYMYAHPGKKLLFMGNEFGQRREWNHDTDLEWHLLQHTSHQGVQTWVKDLNHLYRNEPALHELDFSADGFEWIDFHDSERNVISFIRKARSTGDIILVVYNFSPVPRYDYEIGVPRQGIWRQMLNSDEKRYGGSGRVNLRVVETTPVSWHGRPHSLSLILPPLSALFLKSEGTAKLEVPLEEDQSREA